MAVLVGCAPRLWLAVVSCGWLCLSAFGCAWLCLVVLVGCGWLCLVVLLFASLCFVRLCSSVLVGACRCLSVCAWPRFCVLALGLALLCLAALVGCARRLRLTVFGCAWIIIVLGCAWLCLSLLINGLVWLCFHLAVLGCACWSFFCCAFCCRCFSVVLLGVWLCLVMLVVARRVCLAVLGCV